MVDASTGVDNVGDRPEVVEHDPDAPLDDVARHIKAIAEAQRSFNSAMQAAARDGYVIGLRTTGTRHTSGGHCYLVFAVMFDGE